MNELTKRIREGRRKGKAIRDTRWLKRATASYKKMTADSEESLKKLKSSFRLSVVVAVLGLLLMLYASFTIYRSGSIFDEELAGLEATIEELAGLEAAIEENQIEEDATRLKMTPELLQTGLRLMEYMSKLPADEDGIYCPTCNREI